MLSFGRSTSWRRSARWAFPGRDARGVPAVDGTETHAVVRQAPLLAASLNRGADDLRTIDLVLVAAFDQLDTCKAVSSHLCEAFQNGLTIGAACPGQRAAHPFFEVGVKVPGPADIREAHGRALADDDSRTTGSEQSPGRPKT